MLILQCRTCSNHIILDGYKWYQVNDSGNLCACIMQLSLAISSNRASTGEDIRPIEEVYRSRDRSKCPLFRYGELTELGEGFLREWFETPLPQFPDKNSPRKKSQPSAKDKG